MDREISMHFNPRSPYEDILEEMKNEFLQKWDKYAPSDTRGLDDFEMLKLIGTGAFAKVVLCKSKTTRKYMAVKVMKMEFIVERKAVNNVLSERRVMHSISYPFLAPLLLSRKDHQNLYLGMPFYNCGDVFALQRQVLRFKEDQVQFYASQVYLALQYLHANNLIYRDLKTENLMLSRKGYVRLVDFGFTKRVLDRTMTFCGTPEYLAPEVVRMTPYADSVDWWAFGVLIFELAAGYSPFVMHRHNPMEMFMKITEGIYDMPSSFSRELKKLVEKLLKVDVTTRLGCMKEGDLEIKNQPWFEDVNWFGILNQEINPPIKPEETNCQNLTQFPPYEDSETTGPQVNRYSQQFEEF